MHVAVIPVVLFCTAINPAVDKIAGAFPKFLPLAIAVTISDVACVAILHAPSAASLAQILSDVATVVGDVRQRRIGLRK